MKTLTLALAFALVAPAASADPGDRFPKDPRNAELLLAAIDIPLTPETVARAALTEQHAARVATDVKQPRYPRVRAVGALGVIGTDSARRLIETLAVADRDEQVRVQAVISLARIWGQDDREAVGGFLVDRLVDAPPVVSDAIFDALERLYGRD